MLNKVKFLWQKKPTYLIFWVAQGCNFTCDHCFNYDENKKKVEELSLDEIEKISSSFDHMKYLTLAGGEPMLRKDLIEITQTFYEKNDLHICNIITNGWFTDRIVKFAHTVVDSCPGLLLNINLSIDGLEHEHDFVRQKNGSFKKCLETFHELKKLKRKYPKQLEISANGVYTAHNQSVIEQTADFIIDEVGVPYVISLVRGEDIQNNDLKKVDVDHFFKVANRIYDKNSKLLDKNLKFEDVIFGVQRSVHQVIYDSVKHDKMTSVCQAGKKGIVMTASGEVLLCEILGIRLGNIRDYKYNIEKILSTDETQREIKKIIDEKCHCTWECFQQMNTVFDPKQYPKVISHTLKGHFGR